MPRKVYPSRRVRGHPELTRAERKKYAKEIKTMNDDGFTLWGVKVFKNKRVVVYTHPTLACGTCQSRLAPKSDSGSSDEEDDEEYDEGETGDENENEDDHEDEDGDEDEVENMTGHRGARDGFAGEDDEGSTRNVRGHRGKRRKLDGGGPAEEPEAHMEEEEDEEEEEEEEEPEPEPCLLRALLPSTKRPGAKIPRACYYCAAAGFACDLASYPETLLLEIDSTDRTITRLKLKAGTYATYIPYLEPGPATEPLADPDASGTPASIRFIPADDHVDPPSFSPPRHGEAEEQHDRLVDGYVSSGQHLHEDEAPEVDFIPPFEAWAEQGTASSQPVDHEKLDVPFFTSSIFTPQLIQVSREFTRAAEDLEHSVTGWQAQLELMKKGR